MALGLQGWAAVWLGQKLGQKRQRPPGSGRGGRSYQQYGFTVACGMPPFKWVLLRAGGFLI